MRKAQVTVFIIIGIVLLLSVGLIVYFTREQAVEPVKRTVEVPEGTQEVYDYVSQCLNEITREGLVLLGAQGGYIEIPAVIERNPNAYVKQDPAGLLKTVHWYFEGEDRTPSIDYMERSLALFVKANMAECIDNFEPFRERYDIQPKGEIIPDVKFTDNQVLATLYWPIEITTPTRVMRLDEFIYDHDVPIKRMHETATKIMKFENENAWFENLTIDFMSAFEDIPVSGMEIYCGTRKWLLPEIKKDLQNLMHYNLPYVIVENTNFPEPLESIKFYDGLKEQASEIRQDLEAGRQPDWPENPPADTFAMNRMRFDVGQEETGFKVAFVHQKEWPFNINAQPSKGAVLSSSMMKGPKKYLRFVCLNQYHFAYDIIYPIKVMIRDDNAFREDGYVYQFSFPVIIEDNEEARDFFGMRRFIVPDEGGAFCEQLSDNTIDVRAKGFVEGSPAAEELEDVEITYECMNQICELGTTGGDGSGAIRLFAYLPEGCGNPKITGKKEGYLPGSEHYTEEEELELYLPKLQSFNYSLRVHPYYEAVSKTNPMNVLDSEWLTEQDYSRLSSTTHATISIIMRGQDHEQYLVYPPTGEHFGNGYGEVKETKADLLYGDANYDIDIFLFKGDNPIGGYHAENLTIREEDFRGKNEMVFHLAEYRPMPVSPSQKAAMFMFLFERGEKEGVALGKAFKPTFK